MTVLYNISAVQVCDEESPAGYAGYCRTHYVEYLCGLVIREKLEVVRWVDRTHS